MTGKLLGIVGFKNAGKTTLTERLVRELSGRGYRVATVKHAHHAFDIDHEGRDSWRHRQAGAAEVAVVSRNRWALVHELRGEPEPPLAAIVAKLAPADLVITEGYKGEALPKIEVRNPELGHPELAGRDPHVIAVAASGAVADCPVPVFAREDAAGIADFIVERLGLAPMTSARKLLDDCFLHDRDRLKHDEALALIAGRAPVVAGIEDVALERAAGRILAEDVRAPRPVPGFTNAAVDGYALAHASLGAGATRLKVTAVSRAGAPASHGVGVGEAARIFTGAVMPEGTDTCIMQEDVEAAGDTITVPPGARRGANVRKAGEDLMAGDMAAAAGTRLRPQDIAAIASTGAAVVRCRRPLTVALLSTGQEIRRPGAALGPGEVYDSNHHLLRALLPPAAAEIIDFGIIADDAVAVHSALTRAAKEADVIVSTGGASRGEADHIVAAMLALGELHAWQLAVKPGRPLAIGRIGEAVFLGLPGNPVAVFTTFLLYCQPMLARLGGAAWRPPARFPVAAGFRFENKKRGRREFWRGWIEGGVLKKFARDGSGLISGLTRATGFIEVEDEVSRVEEGDLLPFIPFSEFGIAP